MALITARGGSKSLPMKNIRPFCGRPLILASIEVALSCESVARTIVSTDSEEIARISREGGAEVPFMRPSEYAQDDTPDLPVFVHCLEWLRENEGYEPDIIVHLRPTSPLRTAAMVDEAVCLLAGDENADSVRTVCPPSQNPFKMWRIGEDDYLTPLVDSGIPEQYNQPRQMLPQAYWQNGYVDVTRPRTILEKRSMTGDRIRPLVVDDSHVIDIDNDLTLRLAETIYERIPSGT